MKLSVALCTYNGKQFLAEQLASILAQTRPPEELVVCDDASSDASAEILRDFAARAPFPVRLEINEHTLGPTRNFARAISLCTGDVIALADQDDVWLPHKLETLESASMANPQAGFLFSDAEMVDAAMRPLGYSLWDAVRFWPREQERFRRGEAFACLLRRYRVTGATMAFRSQHRDRLLPIPREWHHDAWIALAISAVAPCALVEKPLIRYRQHGRQLLGRPKRGLLGQFRMARKMSRESFTVETQRYIALRDHLEGVAGLGDDNRKLLLRKLEHMLLRAALRSPGVWRLPRILKESWRGNYCRFSAGWKAVAQDLLLA